MTTLQVSAQKQLRQLVEQIERLEEEKKALAGDIRDKFLEAKGLEVMIARDGNQGLAITEREEPDLVILDMMMPKRSGFLVLEKLRRTRENPPRIIMITANEGSRHKAYAEMLGVDDYIRKPFPMDRLMASVDRLLS